jgi:hypothetical protein|tara:strand:+ start:4762 stop:5100 length:339 start_codon:yes stop_codon:yes gene_type:complete
MSGLSGFGPFGGRGFGNSRLPHFGRTAIFGDGTGNDAEGRGTEGNANGGAGVSQPQDPLAMLLLGPFHLANTVLGTLAQGSGMGPRRYDPYIGVLPTGKFSTKVLQDGNFFG